MASEPLDIQAGAGVPVDEQQLKAAHTCIQELLKSLKQMALYRHQPSMFSSFVQKAHGFYRAYFDAYGDLELQVSPRALTLHEAAVLEEGAETRFFVARMHSEGVRKLTFHSQLEPDELREFAMLFVETGEADSQVDLVTRWWQAGFRHITSVVVDTLEPDEAGAVEMEVERLIQIFKAQLAGTGPDIIRSIQVSTIDFETSLESVEAIRAIVRDGAAGDDAARKLGQKRLDVDQANQVTRLLPLFAQLPAQSRTAELIVRRFLPPLAETCFRTGRFDAFGLMWQAVEAALADPAQIDAARKSFADIVWRPQHVDTLAAALNDGAIEDGSGLVELAVRFGTGLEAWWVEVFQKVERQTAREMLVNAMRHIPELRAEPLAQLLSHTEPGIVRRAIQVVAAAGSGGVEALLARCLDAREPEVRIEALEALAARGPATCRRYVGPRLESPDPSLRQAAVRALARHDPQNAGPLLAQRANSKTFAKLDEPERAQVIAALAATGQPAADEFFDGQFVPVGVFSAGQKRERQLEVARALVADLDQEAVERQVRRILGFPGLNEAVRAYFLEALRRFEASRAQEPPK